MNGVKLPRATIQTVQSRVGEHTIPVSGAEFVSHSCEPNCRVAFNEDGFAFGDLVTLREVKAGEAISFNYLTTEWSMSVPFDCQCGSSRCLGVISGFKFLQYPQRSAIQHLCSPFIMSRLNVDVPAFTMRGDSWYLDDVKCGKALAASRGLDANVRCSNFLFFLLLS